MQKIAENVREDITIFPYNTPEYKIVNGITCLQVKGEEIPLKIFGEHNLQNLNGARLVCKQLGIQDKDFYQAIADFPGAANRLQKIAENSQSVAFKDFAHSPSKLKATVHAVKKQYPDRELVACMELHTFSSLTTDFLPQYKDAMSEADVAYVYYNPEVIKHKQLSELTPQQVSEAFGGNNLQVYTDTHELQKKLREFDYTNKNLLLMTSGNFSGVDLVAFANELIHD